jgi:Autographiviridae endonuclease VII
MTYTCSKCKRSLPLSCFSKNKHKKRGHEYRCKDCMNTISRAWRAAHPEKVKEYKLREKLSGSAHRTSIRKHGWDLSLEKIQELRAEARTGSCAICGLRTEKPLCIDHNHATNEFRGLLCRNCNQGLGHFRDNPELLRKAAKYLEQKFTMLPTELDIVSSKRVN